MATFVFVTTRIPAEYGAFQVNCASIAFVRTLDLGLEIHCNVQSALGECHHMDPQEARQASELFRRYRKSGDSTALTGVFDRVAPELFALACHLTRDMAEAEDLVQQSFLIAIQRAWRWDPKRPVVPWLAGILIREARKSRRRAARRPEPDRLAARTEEDGQGKALEGELRRCVEAAFASLPERYVEVTRAHLLDGEAPYSIANRLQRAPGTVRVQLHRGLELLRKALPAGLGLGFAGLLQSRGLAAVRTAVRSTATAQGPAVIAAGVGTLTWISIPLIGVATVSAKSIVITTAAVAMTGLGAALLPWAPPLPIL